MDSGAKRDEEGYIWITGRIDDMVNVSGHLLSTAEVESALIEHEAVAEAASVSHPHHIKGECIYCFVTLKEVCILCPFFFSCVGGVQRAKMVVERGLVWFVRVTT